MYVTHIHKLGLYLILHDFNALSSFDLFCINEMKFNVGLFDVNFPFFSMFLFVIIEYIKIKVEINFKKFILNLWCISVFLYLGTRVDENRFSDHSTDPYL